MMCPLELSRSAYLRSTGWGSLWLESLSLVYASSWIGLISIRGPRRTNSETRERVRSSLRRGRISGRTATTIIDLGGILASSLGLQLLKWLIPCSKNRCIKFWRRSRTSHISNGRIKWVETPWDVIRAFIANATRSEGIPPRIAELCGIIWSNKLGRKGYSIFCIVPTGKETNQGQELRGMLLWGPW